MTHAPVISLLIDGRSPADPAQALASDDRGFQYGDGLFETARCRNGNVRLLDAHLQRLRAGCERLGIAFPDELRLRTEIAAVCGQAEEGVLKIILTRGRGGRGYRPMPGMTTTRIVALHPLPSIDTSTPITLRWCDMRLGRNPSLAGMKHLNRLEQVLAQREWNPSSIEEGSIEEGSIAEGLMLDTEGELVSGTMSNVFIVSDGLLITPDLRYCGVRGVMRDEVLRVAAEQGIAVSEEPLWPHDVDHAKEVFITNAVHGIRAVGALETIRWGMGPVTQRLSAIVNC